MVLCVFCFLRSIGLCPIKSARLKSSVGDGDKVSWEVGVRRALHQSESMEFESLLNLLTFFYAGMQLIFAYGSRIPLVLFLPSLSIGS